MSDELLAKRGIEAAAEAAGWVTGDHNGKPGWFYPVYWDTGEVCETVKRWKARESLATPKYVWEPAGVNHRPVYYMLPGTLDAIREMGGNVVIAHGEPDLLAFRSSGWEHVISFFGELSGIPKTLADDLTRWGVKRVMDWPDFDVTGRAAAQRVRQYLMGSGIEYVARALPSTLTHFDVNALWIERGFHLGSFREALMGCALLELSDTPPEIKHPTPPAAPTGDNIEAVREIVCQQIAAALKPRGGKAGYYECPLDPPHGPDGKDFLFDPVTGAIGGCQGKHAGQFTRWVDLAEKLGIDVSQIARDQTPIEIRQPPARRNGNGDQAVAQVTLPTVSSDKLLGDLRGLLRGEIVSKVEPFLCPYKALHRLGGNAKWWIPGKIALIIGPSGMGKTSLCETFVDGLRLDGRDSIIWGPEWTGQEYMMRAVAGAGGPSYEAQFSHLSYLLEKSRGIERPDGEPLPSDGLDRALGIVDKMRLWPGQAHFIEQAGITISQLCNTVAIRTEELRRDGRRVSVFFLDYIQKMQARGDFWAELELILGEVWRVCADYGLFGIVNSQVNKGKADDVRGGKTLSDRDAQALSPQKPNLVLTLNPIFEADHRVERARIVAVKNSVKHVPSYVTVKTAFYRHRWTETVVDDDDEVELIPWWSGGR